MPHRRAGGHAEPDLLRRLGTLVLLLATGIAAIAAMPHLRHRTQAPPVEAGAYQREWRRLAQGVRQAELADDTPRYAQLRYRQLMLSGDTRGLAELAEHLRRRHADDDLLALRIDLALHRTTGALNRLAPLDDGSTEPALLRAQILLQLGEEATAESLFRDVLARERRWEALAGLAAIETARGDNAAADRHYAQAADELDVRQMRTYCWVLLQRGWLRLRQGQTEAAITFYALAESAYDGYWLVDDHMAEALAAAGRYDEAVARYRISIDRASRPESWQALGELYHHRGDAASATPWLTRARDAYEQSVARGETHYLHHLASLYADAQPDPPRAVELARRDFAQRPTRGTRDALAWALYRDGQFAAAHAVMVPLVAQGSGDAEVYLHAGLIHLAAGHADLARGALERASTLNPNPGRFHVHR
ncbi:tetratricopeptide repeat protein [Tahibacter amnicola]|uniref:Tetratricopeptide repeat protein n=1 Tax=Tahibacter amnicola TaxID=2976241 RepID=A0ABY6BGM0_9GAMM|nr:tetratricopeptide repeat protein [Tahibacter amnicola]UXI68985.1 tetratricopeptide repeat protein [Tahibacter amnicola]